MEAHWREFGAYLRDLMEKAEIETVTEFAERSRLTLTQTSRILNGQSGTRRTTLPQIVEALGIIDREEITKLYMKAGFTPPIFPESNRSGDVRQRPELTYEPDPDAQEPQILAYYDGLPADEQDELTQIARMKWEKLQRQEKVFGRRPEEKEEGTEK